MQPVVNRAGEAATKLGWNSARPLGVLHWGIVWMDRVASAKGIEAE
ncbi:MAG: hypothetical protein OJF49_001537 [Ktedonobacterales bacterium]|nr:MAG: hypothetical protein OJF49_001537 [Ktedonobacterales bacterium]